MVAQRAFALLGVLLATAIPHGGLLGDPPAGSTFKNIQVLKHLRSSEVRPAMGSVAAALGVSCEYCHTNPWESDVKPKKAIARKMMAMTMDLNRTYYAGKNIINCGTCHNGHPIPIAAPSLHPSSGFLGGVLEDTSTLTANEIFGKYIQALGGQALIDKLSTRVTEATEVNGDGTISAVRTFAKLPDKFLSITSANPPGKGIYTQGFANEIAWSRVNNGRVAAVTGVDLAQLTRDAEFVKGISHFRKEFIQLRVVGATTVNGHKRYFVEGRNAADFVETLSFDAATGLLTGRYGEIRTALGPIPFQAEYLDYRKVDGVLLPFTVEWSMPGNTWRDRVTKIKHNVPLRDDEFVKPQSSTPLK
jgi:hypothetical protein